MRIVSKDGSGAPESLPTRGAWIEITVNIGVACIAPESLPTRGAWIEITKPRLNIAHGLVAPHTGSVD